MEKRSHRRIRDLDVLAAFQGLVSNEIGMRADIHDGLGANHSLQRAEYRCARPIISRSSHPACTARPVHTQIHGAAPTYLVRDNDCAYGHVFSRRVMAMGIRDRRISPRSPWQTGVIDKRFSWLSSVNAGGRTLSEVSKRKEGLCFRRGAIGVDWYTVACCVAVSALSCFATVKMTVSNFRRLKHANRIRRLAFSLMMEWNDPESNATNQ